MANAGGQVANMVSFTQQLNATAASAGYTDGRLTGHLVEEGVRL